MVPGDFESAKFLKNSEKEFTGNYFRNSFVSEGILKPRLCHVQIAEPAVSWLEQVIILVQRPPPFSLLSADWPRRGG